MTPPLSQVLTAAARRFADLAAGTAADAAVCTHYAALLEIAAAEAPFVAERTLAEIEALEGLFRDAQASGSLPAELHSRLASTLARTEAGGQDADDRHLDCLNRLLVDLHTAAEAKPDFAPLEQQIWRLIAARADARKVAANPFG